MRKLIFAALVLVGCNAPKDAMNRGTDNNGLSYPAGPYGYTKHAVMANLGFVVKEDPMLSQGTADYANLTPAPRTLADYYNDPNVSWLVLTGAAGWCGPCREEARTVPADSQKWEPMGVRFVTVLIQGFDETNQTPSTMDDVDRWQSINKEHIAIGTDPNDSLHEYASEIASFPLNVLIRTADMSIQYTALGIDPNNPSFDPILQSYVQQ
jgi:thiol-disulfide isomerase/thioredoxin